MPPPRRGPAELSRAYGVLLPPALLRPLSRTAPRRVGEVEQGEARGGRAGGDAQGARVGAECVGTHPAAVPTPARDLAETPVGAALRGSCPRLHSTTSETLATPPQDLALIRTLLPAQISLYHSNCNHFKHFIILYYIAMQ